MAEPTTVKKPAALRAYKPSLRERAQIGMEGLYTRATGREPGYAPRRLMGKASELLDFIPGVGDVIGVDETKRALDRRQYLEAGLTGAGTLLGVVPIVGDVAGKVLKGAAKPAQQAAEKLAAKYTAERAPQAIQLGRREMHPGTKGFIEDYRNATSENPLDASSAVHGDYAVTELSPSSRGIHLSDIRSLQPGAGGGTRALKELKALADKHNVPITGTAVAYHRDPKYIGSSTELRDWYKKHGFEDLGGDAREGYDIR